MTNGQVGSILAVDCGSTTTKAILLDVVDGQYRVIARGQVPSTSGPPWNDVTAGIYHAVDQITARTGRRILDEGSQLIVPERGGGQGVDILAATISASPPLRVVIAGLCSDVSLESARRAARGTYSYLVGQIAVDGSEGRDDEQWLQLVQNVQPDLILLVGGVDGGAVGPVVDVARLMALAVQLEAERPPIIYAGNVALRSQIADIVGEQVELRAVDNVRPTLEAENLGPAQAELEGTFRETALSRLPGLGMLQRWSQGEVLPTAQGFGHVIRYLDRLSGVPRYGVLGIDVGGMTTTIAAARDGRFSLTVLTELGVGANVGQLLRRVPLSQVSRWLPQDGDPDRIQSLVMNKGLRPWTVPQTEEDLLIEQAVTREVISLALTEARRGWPFRQHKGSPVVNEIVGSGSVLSHAPSPGHAALMLLDAVQPAFWTSRLLLDKTGVLPALGAMATVQPIAAAQMLEQDGRFELGSVISPVGVAHYGSRVLSFKVRSAVGAYEGDVRFGSLERIILPTGEKAILELRPTHRFDLGVGPGRGVRMEVWGGAVGVIIDARGRPLVWSEREKERRLAVQQWLRELGAWTSALSDPAEHLGDF
ncbi:MAG: glutamate mutase L [Anaerolineae bacterium]|nr:MAG: glutamate mutase L [Anaerolineae bacterium]